jgi:hypothetical protein
VTLHTRGEVLVVNEGQTGRSEACTGYVRHRWQGSSRHRVVPSGKPAGKRGVGRRISGTLACAGTTTDERAQRVLIELATEYEAIAAGSRVAV